MHGITSLQVIIAGSISLLAFACRIYLARQMNEQKQLKNKLERSIASAFFSLFATSLTTIYVYDFTEPRLKILFIVLAAFIGPDLIPGISRAITITFVIEIVREFVRKWANAAPQKFDSYGTDNEIQENEELPEGEQNGTDSES